MKNAIILHGGPDRAEYYDPKMPSASNQHLSIHPNLKVDKVVLVAPWLDPVREYTKDFFDDFDIDPNSVGRTAGVTVFYSDDDQAAVLKTVEIVREQVRDVQYKKFHGYKHFCFEDMHTIEFPELLAEVTA